ncbi:MULTISPECIES: DUF2975 domain-containing protein [unclassified Arthrobacter]|uniref:DUF2975 domain-containing protein n=1 Tax=unclassified Arthrobacter TaxID=235627 RepID=UPI0021025ACF|nr:MULTISPECIES: DUF2975 domain-containing protein [unclassified Arthrobacter]MCQ1947233.1 DUF2975 domain-containing protein [Arthrobacter sp. zg-Y1116]MCQ1995280.1 DUF2975 domain-containing protein [Arthrobacter sp. zg-Y1171]UWX80681.1 DUF2975 domain-containing protein [Arthrobacter sp. zg-Y1171]
MTRQEALPLRCAVVAFAVAALLTQLVVVPRMAARSAAAYPEVADLASSYITVIGVAVAAFELALLAAWQLVSAAAADRSVTRRSTGWANIMAVSLGVMAVLFAGVFAHAGFIENIGGPAILFGLVVFLALIPVAFAFRYGVLGWLAAPT